MRFLKGEPKQTQNLDYDEPLVPEFSVAMDDELCGYEDSFQEDDWMQEEQLELMYLKSSPSNYEPQISQSAFAMETFSKSPTCGKGKYPGMGFQENPFRIASEVVPSKKQTSGGMMLEEFMQQDSREDYLDAYSFAVGMEEFDNSPHHATPVFTKETEIIEGKHPVANVEIFSHYGEPGGRVPGDVNQKRPLCNCSKTQCLKLYCLCFRQGLVCHPLCKCVGCMNTTENMENIKLNRNQKVSRKLVEGEESTCNCKMSFCEKSYCACARSRNGCSKLCKCFNCKNPHGVKRPN